MTEILSRSGTVEVDSLDEQARKAVTAFRALQPTLSAYARMITGRREIRVVPSAKSNGQTDGTVIQMRPPLALADNTPHQRSMCDRRDENGLQTCPACIVREKVMRTIFHEIGHIAGDSFKKTTAADKAKALDFAVQEVRSDYANRVRSRLEGMPKWMWNDYQTLAGMINPYLPFLVNCLEDSRVDAKMFKARPGLKRMFDADTKQIFREGFENSNGETIRWSEAPQNNQAMIGTFCKASGYDITGWFHPLVEEALSDADLTNLCKQVGSARHAGDIFNLSFKVLARLRELGFCGTPEDPDPEPEPEEDDEQDDQEDQTPDSGSDPEEGTEGEEGEDESDSSDETGDSESGEDGSGDSTPSSDKGSSDEAESDTGQAESDESDEGELDEDSEDSGPEGSSSGSEEGDEGDPSGTENSSGPGEESSESEPASGSTEEGVRDGGSDSLDPNGDIQDSDETGDDSEPVDTGADDGYGGTRVDSQPVPDMGTPEDLKGQMERWGDHEKPTSLPSQEEAKVEEAVETALVQGLYFTNPSKRVHGVREHFFGKPHIENGHNYSHGWDTNRFGAVGRKVGRDTDLDIPEQILQPAILHARRTFSDNQRGSSDLNLKSGRVNSRVLGKRAWSGDPRLFKKNRLPGRRDYAVTIGMDISASTVGRNLALEKRAIFAQASILDRVGVDFAILAHTGNYHDGFNPKAGFDLEIYHVKDFGEPWNDKTKERLATIGHSSANIDGHAMEFLRKYADKSQATDKIILYYSDGKMPLENYDEELEILQREIAVCKKKGYALLGVGIRTDSPSAHGLPTVRVDEDADLVKVIRQLKKSLSAF